MNWHALEALPALLNAEAVSRAQAIALDEDPQSCGGLEAVIGRHESKYGPDCLVRLCKWHNVSFLPVFISSCCKLFE